MMVSTKALAAIGLTLIIIVPIGLGYILSIDEEETYAWETTTQTKINDLLLNHETPYYGSYKGTTNNSTLISGGSLAVPQYVTQTSTYSPLPIYSIVSDTLDTTHDSVTITSRTAITNDPSEYPSAVDYSGYDGFQIHAVFNTSMTVKYWNDAHTAYATAVINPNLPSSTGDITIWPSGDGTYQFTMTGDIAVNYSNVFSWFMQIENTSNIAAYHGVSVPSSFGAYEASVSNGAVIVNNVGTLAPLSISVVGNEVTINGVTTTYESAPTVKFVSNYDVTVRHTSLAGTYADPAAGWTLPAVNTIYNWTNNQVNNSVTIYAYLPSNTNLHIGNYIIYTSYAGTMLVTDSQHPQTVGTYQYCQIVYSNESITVAGLASWPTMGAVPTLYNQVSYDRSGSDFYTLPLLISSQNIHLRVDNANVVAGQFPSTLNYTLNLGGLFPDSPIDIMFNSVGIYGDYLTIAGLTFTVDHENGTINYGDFSFKLLHAHIGAWALDDGGYSIRINGEEITTSQNLPFITFGGEWVVTATAYKLEMVPHTNLVWQSGQFELDNSGFAAAAILTALACIVILGMTGGRSMGKMGLLILVCGGAAIVAFVMV